MKKLKLNKYASPTKYNFKNSLSIKILKIKTIKLY